MLNLGTVPANSTLYIPWTTYDANGASVTMSGLATSDILIFKNGGTTQRASVSGFTLLDTDGIDFDSITGLHGISIDLSDNADAGFYAVGSWYWVVISTVTVSAQTITLVPAIFRIGPAENIAGTPVVDVGRVAGTAQSAGDLATLLTTIDDLLDTEVAAIKAKTDNLPADPADASDIASSFGAVNSTLSTIAGYIDTEVSAIKAKTDNLTFTVAGVLDANIQYVNDVAVTGTGAVGDEWGP